MSIDPMLLNFPDHFETQRLLLRAPRPGDGVDISEAVNESHEALREWMPWAKERQSVDESEMVARRMAAKFITREDLMLLMIRKDDGQFLGGTGLHRIDWSVPAFEIGYWIRTTAQGNGYVTEAVNGITRFAFEQLKAERIEIRCDTRNERSAAVARRAGYTLEATRRRDAVDTQGGIRDTFVFVKVRGDAY